jgi:hypothetical protein
MSPIEPSCDMGPKSARMQEEEEGFSTFGGDGSHRKCRAEHGDVVDCTPVVDTFLPVRQLPNPSDQLPWLGRSWLDAPPPTIGKYFGDNLANLKTETSDKSRGGPNNALPSIRIVSHADAGSDKHLGAWQDALRARQPTALICSSSIVSRMGISHCSNNT